MNNVRRPLFSEDSHPDQTLQDAFSLLSLSGYKQPSLYPPYVCFENNGSDFNAAAPRGFAVDGYGFPQRSSIWQMQERNFSGWDNSGLADVGPMPSQNIWVSPDIGGSRSCWQGSYPASSVNGISPDYNSFVPDAGRLLLRQNESGRTPPNLNGDNFCVGLQPLYEGIINDFLPDRSNFPGLNSYERCPQLLQKPVSQLSIDDFRGNILYYAKDQFGCRVLQEIMGSLEAEEVSEVFFELIEHIGELMTDPSGNYVFQKLVEVCTEEQRTRIILMVTNANFQLINICLNMHGTRAVQKLLEHVTTQRQRSIIMSALSPGAVVLTKDANGHHVILHCLKYFSPEDNQHLLNEVANNCFEIATDKSGCCVLQQCVNHAQGETKEHLMAEIIANASLLAEDCYGNYVVQHLVSLKIPRVTGYLLRQLQGRFFSLSCNKYGSNVVERFFQDSGEQHSTQIIFELLQNDNVSALLVDPFGNYVFKSALDVSKGPIRSALWKLVQIHFPIMRSNLYGKKLLSRFDKVKMRHL